MYPNHHSPSLPRTRGSISLPPGTILKTSDSIPESEAEAAEFGMVLAPGVQASLEEEIEKAHGTLYKQGLLMRKKVLGEEWVEKKVKGQSEFGRGWEKYATVRT